MAGSSIFSNQHQDEDLFFWIIVQACKDIVFYGQPTSGGIYTRESFLHAMEWISDGKPQQIGDREFTFTEALEAIGVDPRNVEPIRNAILRGPTLCSEERKALARECYYQLEGQDNEPSPFWRSIQNAIMNKDTGWAEEDDDVQDELGRY